MVTDSPPPPDSDEVAVDASPDAASQLAALLHEDDAAGAIELARSLHPAELGDALCGIDADVRALVIDHLASDAIGAALGYMEPHYRDDLLDGLPAETVAQILVTVPDDIATDVVQELSPAEALAVVDAMPEEAGQAIRDLLPYAEETAGGRMTGQRIMVWPDQTLSEVIDHLRTLQPDVSTPFYIYVTDAQDHLEGVLNTRSILTGDPRTPVRDLMTTDLVTVNTATDQEEVARLIKRYRLLALPVVDDDGHLQGTVTSDDLLDVLEEEATEDIFRMAGVDEDEDLSSVLRSVRYRLPWLSVNLATVLLGGWVVSLFQDTLTRVAILAAFLPMIAGMGGTAGTQTATIVVRSLALGRVTLRHTVPVIAHELGSGALIGLATGSAIGLIGWAWQGNWWLGAVAGIALFANVLVGVTAGVLIPMGLHRLKQDPALSAGVWLTTFTDVLGFLMFLGMAAVLVEHLE